MVYIHAFLSSFGGGIAVGLGSNLESRGKWFALALLAAPAAALLAAPAAAERVLGLDDAIRVARERSPSLALARADAAHAAAATRTSRQYGNPSITGLGGRLQGRNSDVNDGNKYRVTFSQPLESPYVRVAERRVADTALAAAEAGAEAADAELVARVKQAFSEAVRADQLLMLSAEQLELLSRVRQAIAKKVEVGEGPGLDLARAETEVLKARRDVAAANASVSQAQLSLRSAIGDLEDEEIRAEGALPPFELPPRDVLLELLSERSPLIVQARLDLDRARHQVDLQKQLRLDGFGLEAEWEREPDDNKFLVGLRIPLPVWNRRGGEIAEARAALARAQASLAQRELTLARELESLFHAYKLAHEQLALIEDGMLKEARRAMRGAEIAYRSGERGILEYLDAQRTLRQIQLDLVAARGDMERAGIEIERLAGIGQ
jgi:cobalt-zinc-cadmium efflux system outer membrane protein